MSLHNPTRSSTGSRRAGVLLLAMATCFSGLASAQDVNRGDRDRRGGPGGPRFERHSPPPHGRPAPPPRPDFNRDRHGAGPNHSFYRGSRLPPQYRSRQYVVEDWRGHRLSPPPRGYHWVQTGTDYVLVAIATGIIAQILLNP